MKLLHTFGSHLKELEWVAAILNNAVLCALEMLSIPLHLPFGLCDWGVNAIRVIDKLDLLSLAHMSSSVTREIFLA